LKIVGDTVYTTDRSDSVAKSFTLDGKPLMELGTRGQHSDTGTVANWLAERAAGPFNHPTEMIAHPNGDLYVTDGYRNARVHRFTRDGRLVKSWGEPGKGEGQFHLPHSIAFDDTGKLYVADRSNKRIQIFTPDGECLGQWTAWAAPTTSAAARTAISTSPSRKTTASPRRSVSEMDKATCSRAWRAAMSTASASTRRATSTPA
jgi:sugar lactone lactonase YvrE